MNDDYTAAMDDVWNYQNKQLKYFTSESKFMQRGYDPSTGMSLGPKITLNGHSMGTYSLGYMQSRLNTHQRRMAKGQRGLPAWQVAQYQQGISQLAAAQQHNMQQHMQSSLSLFSSQKSAQLGIMQNPIVDAGVQRTVERRQEQKERAKELVEVVSETLSAIVEFFQAIKEAVGEEDLVDEARVEKWMKENDKTLQEVATEWDIPIEEVHDMIKNEQWSEEKFKHFLESWKEVSEKFVRLREILKGAGEKMGAYSINMNGIVLKHPVGELHKILGVSKRSMPVTVSYDRALEAFKLFVEDYDAADA